MENHMSKPLTAVVKNRIQKKMFTTGGNFLVLVAALLTACSHGNGSSPAPQPDGTLNPPPDSQNNETGNRISRILYDLDNNGTYEGERSFSYDNDGRLIAENYVYHDDGMSDTNFGSFSIGAPNYNEATSYSYDSEGLLSLWSITDPTGRIEFSYGYDPNQFIDTHLLSFFDNSGALLQSISFDMTVTGNELTHWESRISSTGSISQSDDLTYNASGQVKTDLLDQGGQQTESTYTYSATGKILNIQLTNIQPPNLYTSDVDFEYDPAGRLTSRLSHGNELRDIYRWSYHNDESGRQREWLVDLLDDGSIEAVARSEYEDGPCISAFIWAPRGEPNFVASPATPYAPGSGYAVIPVCANPAG